MSCTVIITRAISLRLIPHDVSILGDCQYLSFKVWWDATLFPGLLVQVAAIVSAVMPSIRVVPSTFC